MPKRLTPIQIWQLAIYQRVLIQIKAQDRLPHTVRLRWILLFIRQEA